MLALQRVDAVALLTVTPTLHLRCDGALEVEHCHGIETYTAEKMCLDMGTVEIEISGDGLVLDVLQKNRMLIHGRIFSVVFHYGKSQVKP